MRRLVLTVVMLLALGSLLITPSNVSPVPTAQAACSESTKSICEAARDAVFDACRAGGGTTFACYMEGYDMYVRCMYERGCNPFID